MRIRKQGKVINFGLEMAESFKRSHPLPQIIEETKFDPPAVLSLKRLVLRMTQFEDKDRPSMKTVKRDVSRIIGIITMLMA